MDLIDDIPRKLWGAISNVLASDEKAEVQLRGKFKEVLVCTDRRVIIAKSGLMTGHLFGTNIFQLGYGNIGSAKVEFHLLTGYFELSSTGVESSKKSYWAPGQSSPQRSPNCISLERRMQDRFRAAASFIVERSYGRSSHSKVQDSISDLSGAIANLWKLRQEGALSQSEFETAKGKLIGSRTSPV